MECLEPQGAEAFTIQALAARVELVPFPALLMRIKFSRTDITRGYFVPAFFNRTKHLRMLKLTVLRLIRNS